MRWWPLAPGVGGARRAWHWRPAERLPASRFMLVSRASGAGGQGGGARGKARRPLVVTRWVVCRQRVRRLVSRHRRVGQCAQGPTGGATGGPGCSIVRRGAGERARGGVMPLELAEETRSLVSSASSSVNGLHVGERRAPGGCVHQTFCLAEPLSLYSQIKHLGVVIIMGVGERPTRESTGFGLNRGPLPAALAGAGGWRSWRRRRARAGARARGVLGSFRPRCAFARRGPGVPGGRGGGLFSFISETVGASRGGGNAFVEISIG